MNQSGRGPTGRLRNFRSMGPNKLSTVIGQLIFEANDRAAFGRALDAATENFGWYKAPHTDRTGKDHLDMWRSFEEHVALRTSASVSTKPEEWDELDQLLADVAELGRDGAVL